MKRFFLCIFLLLSSFALAREPLRFKNETINQHLAVIEEQPATSGIRGIDSIYYINLAKRPEKRWDMERFLRKYRLHARRVNAVDGSKLSDDVLTKLRGPIYDKHVTRGSTGCALSHFSVWLDAYNRDLGCIWVLEDDVECKRSLKKIPKIIEELYAIDPEWDVLYTDPDTRDWNGKFFRPDYPPCLEHPTVEIKDPKHYLQRYVVSDDLEMIFSRIGTYSMIYSKKGIEKIIKYHINNDVWTHSDNSVHVTPNIKQYVIRYPVVTHSIKNRVSDTAN